MEPITSRAQSHSCIAGGAAPLQQRNGISACRVDRKKSSHDSFLHLARQKQRQRLAASEKQMATQQGQSAQRRAKFEIWCMWPQNCTTVWKNRHGSGLDLQPSMTGAAGFRHLASSCSHPIGASLGASSSGRTHTRIIPLSSERSRRERSDTMSNAQSEKRR